MRKPLSKAQKAFESTLKTICALRKWDHSKRATASQLVAVIFEKKLLPEYMQTQLGGVRAFLESAVPTLRNQDAGHGQGPEVREVPAHLAAFALHAAATNIVLLVEAHRAKREVGGDRLRAQCRS